MELQSHGFGFAGAGAEIFAFGDVEAVVYREFYRAVGEALGDVDNLRSAVKLEFVGGRGVEYVVGAEF